MPRIKFPYKEGDWFMLPLEDKGFAIGIIARENKGEVILDITKERVKTVIPGKGYQKGKKEYKVPDEYLEYIKQLHP